MDSSSLQRAYQRLLVAAETVADVGSVAAPPPGEWDAGQLLAHLVSVDAGVLAAAWSVVAGTAARFDNRLSLDAAHLADVQGRVGDQVQLRRRIRVQGEILCRLAEELTEDELGQPIPTVLMSGDTLLVDGPLTLRDLIGGLADDHVPRHTQQLLALVAHEPVPAT